MSPRARRRARRASICGAALALLWAAGLAGAEAARADLYQWTDAQGVVRYTPDPERIPSSRRGSAVLLEAGMPAPQPAASRSGAAGAAASASTPGSGGAPPYAPDPFNAPTQGRRVRGEELPTADPAPRAAAVRGPAPRSGSATPAQVPAELDARIAALEEAVARDQTALLDLVSHDPDDAGADIHDSPELREIAARLPKLQADLAALRAERQRLLGE